MDLNKLLNTVELSERYNALERLKADLERELDRVWEQCERLYGEIGEEKHQC